MNFKKWLEVGIGGGVGGGVEPPKQDPTKMPGAWPDYHLDFSKSNKNPKGKLPPVTIRKMKK